MLRISTILHSAAVSWWYLYIWSYHRWHGRLSRNGRLEYFNLKFKSKKCHFFWSSVLFLGYVLCTDGLSANPENVDKVNNWPVYKNTKGLHSFIILATFHRQVIDEFANITHCLHDLTGPPQESVSAMVKLNQNLNPLKEDLLFWTLKEALVTVDWCIIKRTACPAVPGRTDSKNHAIAYSEQIVLTIRLVYA